MTLSVCMIVRDEAARLAAAIESVRGIADEIVVVDTGSTDETPRLAATMGARVATFPWGDDFAAARNHSFSLAQGEWIFFLDADQRLENPGALPTPLEGEAYRIRIVDSGVESWRVGLVRASARMVGRIHEYFHPPLATRDSELRIVHEGFVGGPSEAKHRRNLPLLTAELAERPERLDIRIERTRTLTALGDPSALVDALAHIDPAGPPPGGYVAMLIEAWLPRPDRPDWLPAYAQRWFPASPPLRWILAREAVRAGEFETAHVHLERLVGMAERGEYDRAVAFDARLLGPDPRLQLAGVRVRLGRLDEAERDFAALVDDPDVGSAARANLAAVRELRRG